MAPQDAHHDPHCYSSYLVDFQTTFHRVGVRILFVIQSDRWLAPLFLWEWLGRSRENLMESLDRQGLEMRRWLINGGDDEHLF